MAISGTVMSEQCVIDNGCSRVHCSPPNEMMLLSNSSGHLVSTNFSSSTHRSNGIKPISDLRPGLLFHSGDIFGPINDVYKWLQQKIVNIESKSSNSSVDEPIHLIDIAMSKEEQNMEIICQNGEYFLEAIHTFRLASIEKQHKCTEEFMRPKAWLAKEIEAKLVLKPGKSWINGTETFYCLMCNSFSPYSNLLLLHMILTCPKLSKSQTKGSSPSRDVNNNPSKSIAQTKRSFDIMSLLSKSTNDGEQEDLRPSSTDDSNDDSNEKIDVETLEDIDESFSVHNRFITDSHHTQYPQNEQFNVQRTNNSISENFQRKSKLKSNYRNVTLNKVKNSRINPSITTPTNNTGRIGKNSFKRSKVSSSQNEQYSQQRKRIHSDNFESSNLTPNLVNLYSQFGPSLFANTFASFFGVQNSNVISGVENGFAAGYHTTGNLFDVQTNSTKSSNSLDSRLNPLGDRLSPSKFIHTNLSPTSSSSSKHLTSTVDASSSHPVYQPSRSCVPMNSSFEMLNSPLSGSIITASTNSPESHSDSSSSSSISPSATTSLSPKSLDYDRRVSLEIKEFKKGKMGTQSPCTTSSGPNASSPSSCVNLPPYFLPPSSGNAASTTNNSLLSSMYLLSPSLTALSYQASNVCAYCNTAFRMTSDLVYHMRSHHKKLGRDTEPNGNNNKKRRGDPLRCNICQETFRERHHLTRHMTSHQ